MAVLKVLGFVAVVLAIGFIMLMLNVDPQKAAAKGKERDAIELCVKQMNDPLQELSTRRLTREVCRELEARYVTKWGIESHAYEE